jgi:hypothetical protein
VGDVVLGRDVNDRIRSVRKVRSLLKIKINLSATFTTSKCRHERPRAVFCLGWTVGRGEEIAVNDFDFEEVFHLITILSSEDENSRSGRNAYQLDVGRDCFVVLVDGFSPKSPAIVQNTRL